MTNPEKHDSSNWRNQINLTWEWVADIPIQVCKVRVKRILVNHMRYKITCEGNCPSLNIAEKEKTTITQVSKIKTKAFTLYYDNNVVMGTYIC